MSNDFAPCSSSPRSSQFRAHYFLLSSATNAPVMFLKLGKWKSSRYSFFFSFSTIIRASLLNSSFDYWIASKLFCAFKRKNKDSKHCFATFFLSSKPKTRIEEIVVAAFLICTSFFCVKGASIHSRQTILDVMSTRRRTRQSGRSILGFVSSRRCSKKVFVVPLIQWQLTKNAKMFLQFFYWFYCLISSSTLILKSIKIPSTKKIVFTTCKVISYSSWFVAYK